MEKSKNNGLSCINIDTRMHLLNLRQSFKTSLYFLMNTALVKVFQKIKIKNRLSKALILLHSNSLLST